VQKAPWTDARRLRETEGYEASELSLRIDESLAEQAHSLCTIARLLLPFLPASAAALLAKFGLAVPVLYTYELARDGRNIVLGDVLFRKKRSAAAV